MTVQQEEGGDWSALLNYRAAHFVDVYSPVDIYPAWLWAAASEYFESLDETNMVLPGGRYSCAQKLQERSLPFLEGRSLGQICHIVQLGISQKKLLGYLNGAVVPYSRSQSMVKERCAERQRPCTSGVRGASNLADWEAVRACLQEILGSLSPSSGSPSSIPLSNVKRLFRSRFHMELSETALGHAKLSELFQDPRLRDVCDVRLKGHGYVLLPLRKTSVGRPISIAGNLGLCAEQAANIPIESDLHRRPSWLNPLNFNEDCYFVNHDFAASQAQPFAMTMLSQPGNNLGLETQSGSWSALQASPPIVLAMAAPEKDFVLPDLGDEVSRPQSPLLKEGEPTALKGAVKDLVPQLVAAAPTPTRTRRRSPGPPLLTPSTLSSMGFQVRNTFIHAELPLSSPMANSSIRAHSCPRSMGSELEAQ
jgi:hypothetical protein